MELVSNHPLGGSLARPTRDAPPAHYSLIIESFSQLVQILSNTGSEIYESEMIEASGYKWMLSLYPNGDKERNGEGHISIYLSIVETESLPVGWDVKVNLKLFVYDHVHDTYSIFQDRSGKILHFHEYKTELGFAKLLPLSVFKDSSNGFLSRDKCIFGVEVFVLNYSGGGECISSQQKVETISCYDDFILGHCKWKQSFGRHARMLQNIADKLSMQLNMQKMERKSTDPHDAYCDIARSSTDIPPAHYLLKIQSFSQLQRILSSNKRECYESEIFEASGYKWKLSLYPKGDEERNGEGHLSLYLVIAETESLPAGWELKVNFKMLVFDHVHDTYSIFQDNDGKIRNLHEFKKEVGFAKLLPLGVFLDPLNGFLIHDQCVFGVEVFVLNYSGKGECLSLQQKVEAIHTWTIDNFSLIRTDFLCSDDFTLANLTWVIQIHRKGGLGSDGDEDLSLSLKLNDTQMKGKSFVNYRLRIRDQLHGNHKELTGKLFQDCGFQGKYEWLVSTFVCFQS